MATTRKITRQEKQLGAHKIKPMQILDLTNSGEDITVVMRVAETVQNNDQIDQARQELLDSPWSEDDLAKTFARQNSEPRQLQDPVARLRKVNEILGRQ